MCYAASCNPLCGQCRPKRIVEASCPQCGAPRSMTREEYLIYFDLPHRASVLERKMLERGGVETPRCESCGCDMTEAFRAAVQPAPCRLHRVICGFPCGRSAEPHKEGTPPCKTVVPLGRLDETGANGANDANGTVDANCTKRVDDGNATSGANCAGSTGGADDARGEKL